MSSAYLSNGTSGCFVRILRSIVEIRTPHHAPEWYTLPVLTGVVSVKMLLSRKVQSFGGAPK